ncbi:nuclear pore complex protein Nup205 [Lepeophtheirus salmonis]|uniref:nuclear pore complex protein Nup205 n=1 Tax=Lepeophtheirus salmonis TaxID=72036 RepID=UPI001AE4BA06|nr:nuclear pore complex protein Nup205-like [Lepeophtheirus salmonis]
MHENLNHPWLSLRELSSLVESVILRREPGKRPELETALRKYKPNFIALLKNIPPSTEDAELVKKASEKNSELPGCSQYSLSPRICEEALIVSELFQLNEISSLQLLVAGEEQLSQYPGLTRGLVSVLLYYDSRKALVQSLRSLIQSREGLSWTLETPQDITQLSTAYTTSLLEEGLVDKILTLLKDLDWVKESNNLQKHMALGDAKHRKQVRDLFQEVRQGLADCIYCYAAQSGLPKNETLRLLDYLSKVKPTEGTASGVLDSVNLTLTMAALYAIDISSINKCEDGEETVQNLPLVKDPDFLGAIHKYITNHQKRWEHLVIQSLLQFGWSMLLCSMRSLPQHPTAPNYVDEDESVLDLALENRVFHTLPEFVLSNPNMFKEEFYMRRLHQLLTDLIVLMPLKVKELRNRADDAGRNKLMHDQEGISYAVPLAGQHFEHLLNTISSLYKDDSLALGLMLEYWCPSEGGERLPVRQVSLNKFVRLAGDLLVPSLFMPYLDMLVSLSGHPQAALHCFNLLKVSGQSQVSWDHFFNSLQQYFFNLRQGMPQTPLASSAIDTSTIYMHRPMTRGISPQEIKGLSSVLRLIAAVCNYSEVARVAIGDNSVWQPILVLVGLLGCAVPTNLKSDVLLTLSVLAKSPEFSSLIWQSIESAQLVPDSKSIQNSNGPGSNISRQGIITELEEIESRCEEYPMTRALLTLLDTLTNNSIPSNLGAGNRVPGFDPYLNFIRDHVFLKCHTRSYKIPGEKWQVASLCLKLIFKLLKEYEPLPGLFEKEVHPGFKIVVHLLQTSELLRMLTFILDEGCSILETYTDFPGKEHLEESCLYSLEILHAGLAVQESVLEAARSSNTSLMLTALDKLLLGINPRSGRPDHTLNICRYITYSWWLPKHALAAINVLSYISSSVSAQPGLLATFTSSDTIANSIMKGFTDVLDDELDYETDNAEVIGSAKIAIVKLLQSGLDMPAPSFSHFLLGFDLKKGVSKTNLQQPGILGSIRTPFHALLGILRPPEPRVPPLALFTNPHLCETAYKLIYSLASNHVTSEPTLRYLRSSEDFLSTQLSLLPLKIDESKEPAVHALKAVSWLLKTVAVELKIVSASRLRSQISHLTDLLLDSSSVGSKMVDGQGDDSQFLGGILTDASLTQLSRAPTTMNPSIHTESHGQHRLLALLNFIDFNENPIDPPSWQLFDDAQVNQVLKDCETLSSNGERSIKVQELHRILNAELTNLQVSSSLNQRQLINDEIQNILLYAVRWNAVQEEALTRRHLLDAWRQVTEVLLCSIPLDILPSSSKQQLLLELLQTLLNKVLQDGTMSELSNKVSGVLLLLLAALRQTYIATESIDGPMLMGESYVPILDAQTSVLNNPGKKNSINRVYSTALQVILKGLIQWIEGTSASSQRVRSNLYGALLNYLRIGKGEKSSSVSDINSLELSDQGKLRKANLEVLAGFGENFLEIICRDSVSGHDIRRMLAMSVLEELISLDSKGSWIWYLSNQGYLRHLIESIKSEDEGLLQLMTSNSRAEGNLRTLYTYESKIGMLTRLASTMSGAELLLESGLMLRLAEIQVFSARPEPPIEIGAPSALDRYHQILFPVLRLCQTIMSSLGGIQNRSATVQILHFISANEDLVRGILRNNLKIAYRHRSLEENLAALQELGLLTGVISRCAASDDIHDVDSLGSLSRLQRLMLSLIPQFNLSETVKEYENKNQSEAIRLLLEIHANVINFARNIVTLSANNSKYCRILFTPSLSEAHGSDGHEYLNISIPSRPPSLGHIVTVLRSLSNHLIAAHSSLTDLQDKLSSIQHLSSAELAILLGSKESIGKSMDKRLLASRKIKASIKNKEHEITLAGIAIEGASLLIWRHLEHFLLYACKNQDTPYQKAVKRLNDEPFMAGDSSCVVSPAYVSSDGIAKLKEEAVTVFSDSLFMKLQDVEQLYSKKQSSVGFLEAMIRRLKRLASLHI